MAANCETSCWAIEAKVRTSPSYQELLWPVASQFLIQWVTCCCDYALLMQLHGKQEEG